MTRYDMQCDVETAFPETAYNRQASLSDVTIGVAVTPPQFDLHYWTTSGRKATPELDPFASAS